jgi:hypothetical protein
MANSTRTPYGMATNPKRLRIYLDPAELSLLRENGYELLIATNGSEALRLLMA